jgi:hypothetical protein
MSEPSYRVVFIKQIHSSASAVSSNDYFLTREASLPCPPFQGLTYAYKDHVNDKEFRVEVMGVHRYSGEPLPAEIIWQADENRFCVYVAEDSTFCQWDAAHPTPASVAKVVAEYLEEGWRLDPEDEERHKTALAEVEK